MAAAVFGGLVDLEQIASERRRLAVAALPPGFEPWTRSAQSVPKRLITAARRQAEWGVEWLNEATLLHPPPQLTTRLRSAWRFKSSHPHLTSPGADGLPPGRAVILRRNGIR